MPGLVPGIDVLFDETVDGRDEPGHDERNEYLRETQQCLRSP